MILEVKTFRMDCSDKEQAVKVLEEAAEVFGAWQQVDACACDEVGLGVEDCPRCSYETFIGGCENMQYLADEIADVIQAACNLAQRYEIDMQEAMMRCEWRNRERGRYE